MGVGIGAEAELEEDLLDMRFDGALGDEQVGGDGPVGEPLGDQCQHLALAFGEFVEGVGPGGEEPGDDRRVDDCAGMMPACRLAAAAQAGTFGVARAECPMHEAGGGRRFPGAVRPLAIVSTQSSTRRSVAGRRNAKVIQRSCPIAVHPSDPLFLGA